MTDMSTNVIPRPSTLTSHLRDSSATDVDTRLADARDALRSDTEDMVAGYARTPGLRERVRELEAEYERTYGRAAPKSITDLLRLRREHLSALERA